ncbi:RNA-directed DNA polymerase, eukaryota, reverse transcriptase zinc-binding domain protein [Tanacetum coccineum]
MIHMALNDNIYLSYNIMNALKNATINPYNKKIIMRFLYSLQVFRIKLSQAILCVYVEGAQVQHAAAKLGCLTLNSPFSYLGTKVGGLMSRVGAWKEVIDKVKSRLSKWKMKALSIGGRLTLLKSVLGSIPIFHMSIFRVPSSVLHTLESIRRNFFNGHDVDNHNATWVKWSNVLADKENGGLGVSSLFALNRGLMMKWVWRFFNQKDSLWAKVIKAIHGEDGKVDMVHNTGARTCWTYIINEIRVLKNQGVNILDHIRLKLGNGDTTSFWNDNWSGDGAIKDLYPRLFALENCKMVSVRSKLSDPSLDTTFRRNVRGGLEQVQFDALLELVRKINLVPMGDRWVWSLESSGNFSVASIRKAIDAKRSQTGFSKTRWIRYVPIKLNVLAWKIKTDALPTRLNISRRGIDIQSMTCPICDGGVESSNHLFFSCNLVRQIGRQIARWWDISYVDAHSYDEWYTWILSLRVAAKTKMMIEGIFYATWWSIWTYRNKLIFEGNASSKAIMFDTVVSNSFYWCKFRSKALFSWIDWLKTPCLITL